MKLIILASHPVQYHVPVFREISQQLQRDKHECLVVYLSDFSIQGYQDREFGTAFAWDEPLLAGYRSLILNRNQNTQPERFSDLKSLGWQQILQQEQPTRILVTNLNYQGTVTATLQARLSGIPCTLRVETNDVAVVRSKAKAVARSLLYNSLYRMFDSAIAIGALNQEHLIRHGIPASKVGLAYYCVPNRFEKLPLLEKQQLRQSLRQELGFTDEQTVILFSGKLIPKKNPQLLLEAVTKIPETKRHQIALLFLGAGALEPSLQAMAVNIPEVKVHFAGFKNQQQLPPYYLAADALVLPSKREGETWGLVVNEGLQAGLPCIVSNAVGCAVDFKDFPDFQIIPEQDADALAKAMQNLLQIPRDFERYYPLINQYSVEQSSYHITSFLLEVSKK